jgi:hypothetical protein
MVDAASAAPGSMALSDDTGKDKQSSIASQIAVGVLVALLAGGTAPWWWEKLFGGSVPASPPAKESSASHAVDSAADLQTLEDKVAALNAGSAALRPAISPSFVVGRWEVEQVNGNGKFRSSIDYLPDGTFSGSVEAFSGPVGNSYQVQGTWSITKISDDIFNLALDYSVRPPGIPPRLEAKFKVLDHDHTQNIDQNYVANRIR